MSKGWASFLSAFSDDETDNTDNAAAEGATEAVITDLDADIGVDMAPPPEVLAASQPRESDKRDNGRPFYRQADSAALHGARSD